jgi:hypothetical protein
MTINEGGENMRQRELLALPTRAGTWTHTSWWPCRNGRRSARVCRLMGSIRVGIYTRVVVRIGWIWALRVVVRHG